MIAVGLTYTHISMTASDERQLSGSAEIVWSLTAQPPAAGLHVLDVRIAEADASAEMTCQVLLGGACLNAWHHELL